jgi:hypothetical protein
MKLQGQWKAHEDDLLTQYTHKFLASCIPTHPVTTGPSQILANNGKKSALESEGWHLIAATDIEIISSTATFVYQVRSFIVHFFFVLLDLS